MPKKSFEERAEECVLHMSARATARNVGLHDVCITTGPQARRWGVTRTHATRILERMCNEGYLYREKIIDEKAGHLGRVLYWLTPDCQRAILGYEAVL